MSATILIGGTEARVEDYVWSSEDPALSAALNALAPPEGPSGGDPDPDGNLARKMAAAFGGEVISVDPVEPEPKTKRLVVY